MSPPIFFFPQTHSNYSLDTHTDSLEQRLAFGLTCEVNLNLVTVNQLQRLLTLCMIIDRLKAKNCPTTRHENAWVEMKYSSYSFTNSVIDGGEWSVSLLGRALAMGKGPPVPILRDAGWVSEPVWTQRMQGKAFSSLPGIESRSSGRPACSQTLHWLSYPATYDLEFQFCWFWSTDRLHMF
jgi:hypothetical protein